MHERGNALGIYFTGQFAGPLFGPIFGGYLVERWGWRSVFWLLFVFGCILLLMVFFAMEETYRQESVWGKSSLDSMEGEKAEIESVGDAPSSEDRTVVESKVMNPLASLVKQIQITIIDNEIKQTVGLTSSPFCANLFNGNWIRFWRYVCH